MVLYLQKYFQSSTSGPGKSYLTIEWTNQHGCGGNEDSDPHKLNCNIVLQYMCQPDDSPKNKDLLRNGKDTNTQNYNNNGRGSKETEAQYLARKNNNVQQTRVYQESWEWYDSCRQRNRNKGIVEELHALATNCKELSRYFQLSPSSFFSQNVSMKYNAPIKYCRDLQNQNYSDWVIFLQIPCYKDLTGLWCTFCDTPRPFHHFL